MSAVNLASVPVTNPVDDLYRLNQIDSSGLPTGNNSNLSDPMKKLLKIDEWVRANRHTRSRKLDLLAAIIEADDSTLDAMLSAFEQNRAGNTAINSGRRKKSGRRRRRGLNVQTYLERAGMWKARKAFDPIGVLKWSAAVHFAINCEDPKKIDAILEIAGINTDPKQQTVVRL